MVLYDGQELEMYATVILSKHTGLRLCSCFMKLFQPRLLIFRILTCRAASPSLSTSARSGSSICLFYMGQCRVATFASAIAVSMEQILLLRGDIGMC